MGIIVVIAALLVAEVIMAGSTFSAASVKLVNGSQSRATAKLAAEFMNVKPAAEFMD